MLGFSEEAQGWLPCKITTVMDDKWQIEWWDDSQSDKIKGKTEVHHFEEAGWWYRITGQTGGVNETMRGARSARRKEGPSMRDPFPKEEGK